MNISTAISLKNASTLWHFYCSPVNVFVLWLSGYVVDLFLPVMYVHDITSSGYTELVLEVTSIYTKLNRI